MGVAALGNAVQSYATLSYTRRLYPGQTPQPSSTSTKTTKTTTTVVESTDAVNMKPSKTARATAENTQSPATPLSSRTFGTWTIVVGIVRMYAAYRLEDPAWYQLQMWVTAIALLHFSLEAFVFKTCQPKGPWLAPTIPATVCLIWSGLQYNHYVRP